MSAALGSVRCPGSYPGFPSENTPLIAPGPSLPRCFDGSALPSFPLLPTGGYGEYFGMNTDVDAVVYLMLVNNLLHDLFPNAITIGACTGIPSY